MQEDENIQSFSDEDGIFGDISNTSQGHVRPNFALSTKLLML